LEPHGDVLEVGAGSGAMAAELLARYDQPTMTVTDFDPAMVEAASIRLGRFGDRVTVRQADATALPFPDRSFDAVLAWVMLHHTVRWETALAECVRVLRPGGHVVGYDLLATRPLRLLHRRDGAELRLMRVDELRTTVSALPVDLAILDLAAARSVVRFLLRKGSNEGGGPSSSSPAADELERAGDRP
jgi:ubiquinone/menaquinone biosynthesis C-methylase UbiE